MRWCGSARNSLKPPLVCAISRLTTCVRSMNSRKDELDRSSSRRIVSTAATFESQTLYGFSMRSTCGVGT